MTLEEAKKIKFCNGRGYSTIEFIQALQLTEEIKNNNTMTEENKQLLLKDLCARLPYGVICHTEKGAGHLCSINQTIFGTEYGININPLKRDYFCDGDIETDEQAIKPYLRPMSSMTEEEENELTSIAVLGGYNDSVFNSFVVVDWLNAHHFDYRGLIEKGLALEALEGMYEG